jgi:molybdate transport system permease protein
MLGPEEWQVVILSLHIGTIATFCSLPPAIGVAFILSRYDFIGKNLLNGIVHLPLVLPPVVTGYLLLFIFGPNQPVARIIEALFGLQFAFRWTGAALAAGVMAFPLIVRAIKLSLDHVDPKLEQAAASLGAGPLRVWVTITLPLIAPGIVAGMVLGFAKALGEFGATIAFVSNIQGETRTLPLAIYSFLQIPGAEAAAWRLVALSILISMAALLVSEWVANRAAKRVAGA